MAAAGKSIESIGSLSDLPDSVKEGTDFRQSKEAARVPRTGTLLSGRKDGSQRQETLGAGGGSRTLTGLLSPAEFLTDYRFRRPEQLLSKS
jgi:hypothetical protein